MMVRFIVLDVEILYVILMRVNMLKKKCRCGHVYYPQNNRCPVCSNPDQFNEYTDESFHEKNSKEPQDCTCYESKKD